MSPTDARLDALQAAVAALQTSVTALKASVDGLTPSLLALSAEFAPLLAGQTAIRQRQEDEMFNLLLIERATRKSDA